MFCPGRVLKALLGLGGLAIALGGASCRQVLSIEDAELVPAPVAGADGGDSLSNAHRAGGSEPVISAAGAPDMAAAPSLCERYCSAVMASCTGEFAVYTSLDACLAVCAALPEGEPGDRNVNSVQCRLQAALVAKDEVPHYCPIAGPGGNGECGSNCESLCQLRASICAPFVGDDAEACQQSCTKLTDLGSYSTDLNVGQYRGPHVQCRLYHLCAAAVAEPEQHCQHVDGAAPCSAP
jgi:hypothetical protein